MRGEEHHEAMHRLVKSSIEYAVARAVPTEDDITAAYWKGIAPQGVVDSRLQRELKQEGFEFMIRWIIKRVLDWGNEHPSDKDQSDVSVAVSWLSNQIKEVE